jgi:hypothetical protein
MVHLALDLLRSGTPEFHSALLDSEGLVLVLQAVLTPARVDEASCGYLAQILACLEVGREDKLADLMLRFEGQLAPHLYDLSVQTLITEFLIKNPAPILCHHKIECLDKVASSLCCFDP